MERRKALSYNKILRIGLCITLVVGISIIVFCKKHIDIKKQNALIYDMKNMSTLEYFYFGGSTKISKVTRKENGVKYGIGGGMGNHFGRQDMPLWEGTSDTDLPLEIVPYYLLRISDGRTGDDSQYADVIINYVENSADANIIDFVSRAGFSYDGDVYVVTSNGQIFEVADKSFFIDLFSFLDDKDILPPKVA